MAHSSVPHFHNSDGLPRILVGSKEFQCVGALPPFDHPHVFLDIGKDNEIVCPYCSTLYVYHPELAAGTSEPLSAVFELA
ncbi:MAG: Zinc-finger domain protein [Hyphomicrobiales bacterium]|nr:Zinc-finger domain protein [Hyphomicrobiales bacterium]